MLLGIEIGGTKIQLAAGRADGSPPEAVERFEVEPQHGAAGILEGIRQRAAKLSRRYEFTAAGIGFGGPVDARTGRVIKSHHIEGWTNFPLAAWCGEHLRLPAVVANDADTAGLAEARFGAGRGRRRVFYITIGTGIGGGWIVDGQIYQGAGNAAAEIGHLRPGPEATEPTQNVESASSGWGIAATARRRCAQAKANDLGGRGGGDSHSYAADAQALMAQCGGDLERLTTRHVAEAAAAGNRLAAEVLDQAWQTLGWAVAQMITLLSPEVVVIGGGVSLMGERLCLEPLRRQTARYVFPPLVGSYTLLPAALGQEVVLYGALVLAGDLAAKGSDTAGSGLGEPA